MKFILTCVWEYIKRLDKVLLLMCVAASAFSIVLLYTMNENGVGARVSDTQYKTQLIASALGIAVALVIAAIDYNFISKIWWLYAPLALLFVLLLFTSLGEGVSGADDIGWLRLGPVRFQPSELMKIAFIMTFATHLSKLGKKINQFPHFCLLCLHGMVPTLLIVKQGDDGSALVFFFIFVVMMFAAGLSWKYILVVVAMIPPAIWVLWNYVLQSHQKIRFLVLFDEAARLEYPDKWYQQKWGLIAMGSGELSGKGLLGGDYITFVPEVQNDFIFSYIGMTLGFIGCAATVAFFLALCVKLISGSSAAKDPLGRLICFGVFAMIITHVVVNLGMVLAVLPVCGIPLPFISAGGTSVVANYAAMGLVMSVYAHRDKKYHLFYTE